MNEEEEDFICYLQRNFSTVKINQTDGTFDRFSETQILMPLSDLMMKKSEGQLADAEKRFMEAQTELGDRFDLRLIETRSFILVSFGSLAKTEFMEADLMERFMTAFGYLKNYLVIWATNSEPDALGEETRIGRRPKNVILLKWTPIRVLLGRHLRC